MLKSVLLLAWGLCSLVFADQPVPIQDAQVCLLPKETGPCRNIRTRFHFNQVSGKCEAFIYGGCRGNGNNFPSIEDCHITCRQFINANGVTGDMKAGFSFSLYST